MARNDPLTRLEDAVKRLVAPRPDVVPVARPVDFRVSTGVYADSVTHEVIGNQAEFDAWCRSAGPVVVIELTGPAI